MKSWKTSTVGFLGFVAVLATQLGFMYDTNPATNPDFTAILTSFSVFVVSLFSKDYNVTGAKNE